jgi:hypothetical protein
MRAARHGDVLIDVPPSLGAVNLLTVGVNNSRSTTISVLPASVNTTSYLKLCPPMAIPPCAPNPLNPPWPPLSVGGTLGAAPSYCSPPQQLSCTLQCFGYQSSQTSCPQQFVNCSSDPGAPGTIGCAATYPASGSTGCMYPPQAPPSTIIQADNALLLGRTPPIAVSQTQIATGSLAAQRNCDLPQSVYAPRGGGSGSTDYGFIL